MSASVFFCTMSTPATIETPSSISRTEFLSKGAAALAAFSALGCLVACASKTDGAATTGTNATGTTTLTADQKTTLDSQGFLNLTGLIVIKVGSDYKAYGRTCPHESGEVTALSATSLQCQKHTDQSYNSSGVGNGARTTATLKTYTVTVSSGTVSIAG